MWKYTNKDSCNQFLLSLHLLDNKDDKDYIKKIYAISNNIENNYEIYKVKKKNGKFRTIYAPNSTLKYIQKQILKVILNEQRISKYAKAYHKGISLKDNALHHIHKKIILKLDIQNFFESINFLTVYTHCFSIQYFPKPIGVLLTNLCTYQDFVPQGAPTSAYISNLVMRNFDEEIGFWCAERGISYTRYSDDMTFSGNFNPHQVIEKVRPLLQDLGLKLNNEKTCVVNRSCRQQVTGIVVNEKTQVNASYRKKIRQEIYYIKKFGIDSHLSRIHNKIDKRIYLNQLYGKILFVLQVNSKDKEFIEYKQYLEEYTI